MVWLSNPITMPFMYYMEYLTGIFLLDMEPINNIELTIEWFKNNLNDIFIPLYVGTSFYSIFISSLIYFLTNYFWIKSVHKERNKKNAKNK